MITFAALFPGQGSQTVGMGRAFYDKSPLAKQLFEEADQALGFKLSEICFSGPLEVLTQTQHAQPALLTVSTIAFRLSGLTPVAAAGHSLGEYSALVAAGCLSFADAVRLVHKRGRYMQEAVPPGKGKMVAVMGPSEQEIEAVLKQCAEIGKGVAEIANLNCPGQTVVAGDVAGIDQFTEMIAAQGGKVIPLNVSAPFHCSLMKPAELRLADDLRRTSFKDSAFPVYANVTAARVQSGDEARELLIRQVCGSVRWTELMQNLIRERGVKLAVEFGPGKVLSKLLKRIDKSVTAYEIADSDSLQQTRMSLNG